MKKAKEFDENLYRETVEHAIENLNADYLQKEPEFYSKMPNFKLPKEKIFKTVRTLKEGQ